MTKHGFKDATLNEAQVREWWTRTPDANVAIATGPSGLLVVDVDHGLAEGEAWPEWLGDAFTHTVRTGRRPEFGLQFYFKADGSRSSAGWTKDGLGGDIRGDGGYVLAAGSIHPSGHPYELWFDGPVNTLPEWVKDLAPEKRQFDPVTAVDDATADGWKTWLLEYAAYHDIQSRGYEKRVPNGWWLGIRCPWEDTHGSGPGTESSTVLGILDGKLAFECSHGTCKAANHNTEAFRAILPYRPPFPLGPEPGAEPSVSLGTGLPMPQSKPDAGPMDWRSHYHTRDELENTPPVSFLIDNFLPYQSITAIAAPVRQRKSLIALNVAHALCSGEPLFGHFAVAQKPARVLYLCPEMGLRSFVERARKIGLLEFAGTSFFCRTMNMPGVLELKDLTQEELQDAVVIIDTLIRYQRGGDENSAKDMSILSAQAFRLIESGAAAIVALHHSQKNNSEQDALTLENVMRGSGELGAAMTNAWATRLQNADDEYGSLSYLQNVKPRDYKPDPKSFEVSCSEETCRMVFVESEGPVRLRRSTSNKDGMEDAAIAIIRANPDKPIREIVGILSDNGIKRGKDWVAEQKRKLVSKQ